VDNIIFHREYVWLRGPYYSQAGADLAVADGNKLNIASVGAQYVITVV
jgi:hypothetical protein